MHTWSWQDWDGASYLTCDLLADWPHGFFTRQSWPQTPDSLAGGLHPQATVHRVKQVHGNRVLNPTAIAAPNNGTAATAPPAHPAADGLITDGANQSVWVCSADCNPVLMANGHTQQVAAVHAGWRGTALKIVPVAIQRLLHQGGDLSDLRVAIGPAIAGEVYQVSTQVAAEVGKTLLPTEQLAALAPQGDLAPLLDHLHQLEPPPIFSDPQPGRAKLDVRRVNVLQLLQLGLHAEQIAIAPHCTYQEPDRFFSYRRTKEKKVQWSGIVSR